MPDPELIKKWEAIERDLRSALAAVRVDVPEEAANQVEEYLDHNELGLALEVLIECLLESDVKSLPASALEELHRTHHEMEVPSPEGWQKFTARFG
jgi:hypothetical protein